MKVTLARLVLPLILLARLSAKAESQTCVQIAEFDSLGAGVIRMVRSYTAPVDSVYERYRIGLGYPRVSASEVTLVTKEEDCKKARDEFRARTPQGSGWIDRVVVVKAGNMYTVIDPGYVYNTSAPRLLYVLMNQQFRFVSFLGG